MKITEEIFGSSKRMMGESGLKASGGNAENNEAQKKRKVSKRGKKNMRKNTDIHDVEEHIEQIRMEERAFGDVLSEKKNDDIFFVDTEKSSEPTMPQSTEINSKRERIANKVLFVDRALEPQSKITPIVSKRMKTKTQGAICKSRKREKNSLSKSLPLVEGKLPAEPQVYNIWADKVPEEAAKANDFLEASVQNSVKAPAFLKRQIRLNVSSVELPLPGQSYNPRREDHQQLLQTIQETRDKKAAEFKKLKAKVFLPSSLKDMKSDLQQRSQEVLQSLSSGKSKKYISELEDLDSVETDKKLQFDVFATMPSMSSSAKQKKNKVKRNIEESQNEDETTVETRTDLDPNPVRNNRTKSKSKKSPLKENPESSGDSDSDLEMDALDAPRISSPKKNTQALQTPIALKEIDTENLAKDPEMIGDCIQKKAVYCVKDADIDFRKPKAVHRRHKLTMLKEKMLQEQKKHRIQMNEVYRLNALQKEIKSIAQKRSLNQTKREQARKEYALKNPSKLGKHSFVPSRIEVQNPNQLCENLRNLKPRGNLYLDRLKQFQRKGMIEPRVSVKKRRRYRLKEYVKHSHQM